MSKTIWYPGIPEDEGVYWYDSGFGREEPMLLHVKGNTKYIYGDYGSMPLESIFQNSMIEQVSFTDIEETDEWSDLTCIKKDKRRAWVKTPDGHFGFGLLRPGWNREVSGTIAWLEHPRNGCDHSVTIKPAHNYQFSLVSIPKVKVSK